ncbi:Chromodomain Y-like protein 2 [Eufriesea mexicana]|nr:Chromodomain Y-like protein 2 [Eufriesea mexicana]
MEQIDETQSNINETESSIIIDITSPLIQESNKDYIKGEEIIQKSQENSSQEYTDNIIHEALTINEYDITDSSTEFENKNNRVTENVKNVIINEVKQETIHNDTQIDNNQCIKNEKCKENQTGKVNKIENNLNCGENTSLDKESANNVETFNANEDEQNYEKRNVCTMLNIDTVDDANAQCQALIKTLSETFDDKDQTLHVTDTDADLSKLVDGSSEVMVLTVETINDLNESTEENIVLTVHEKDAVVNSNENNITLKEKDIKKTEILNEDFNLIDYTQDGDGTIIEVISTEIVDSEISETCTHQENKEILNHIASEKDSVTSTTSEVIDNPETVDNTDIKEEKVQQNCGKYDAKQIETNDNDKTESCDNSQKINVEKEVVHNKIVTTTYVANAEGENVPLNEMNKISITKKRSVIQDIFDDWGDENIEDDNQSVCKMPDTVEIELKSLLNDTKTQTIEENTVVLVEEEITCIEKEPVIDAEKVIKVVQENKEIQIPKEQMDNNQAVRKEHSIKSSPKDQINFSTSQTTGKSVKDTTLDVITFSQSSSSQIQIMPINRVRNLTSQIASPAEVTEALKERLREKQKIVEAPPRPDIFFVKKLTQRLSSKLVGSPGSSLPALIPLPQPITQSLTQCDKKSSDNTSTGSGKESNPDNKELLAILEGDVDPDWSNLKPPTLTEEGKRPVKIEQSGYNTPPKLDPLVERELALKQLLELPVAPTKRSVSKKKKTIKPTPSKTSKEMKVKAIPIREKEIVNVDLINEATESVTDSKLSEPSSSSVIIELHTSEKKTDVQDIRLDESRSGRKRKLTEKAREHEQQQNIVKRQKVYKGKVSLSKKQTQENELQTPGDTNLLTESHASKEMSLLNEEADVTITDEITNKQVTNNNKVDATLDKLDNVSLKTSKQNLHKKGSQTIPKRNIVVKKILRQNLSTNKKATALKTKLNTPKKSGSKVISKSKRSTEINVGDSKPKKKIINEIDRLLQDEGVVNLLYDVEQPDKKRLVPITKSQTKVMDLQKVQRELKLRKKLVRNAVLRLRTSTAGVSKVSPRSKRTSIYLSDIQMDKKIGDQAASAKQINVTSQEFILPAKIRNAADASVIIRRHSSSSFSSASGSPRVSIDSPEKNEGVKVDEGGSHSLRSTKRRHSQDERINVKKNETNSSLGKVITRSNGTATSKVTSKTKKTTKNKVTFAKTSEPDNNEEFSKEEDELSACLAEAASALSVVNAGSRSANSTANRKNKVNVNTAKMPDLDNNITKMETRSQFSNKEINVRRHGNLLMQEFRETLSILKKDDDCRVVLLTSTGSSFCEGLELSMLLHTNKEERRIHAQEIADAVKDFIKMLASFNKPIVAGVQGAAVGLGVTMLPLFDLVIASDKATFSTPYGKLGQIAEGAAVFTLSHILGSAITSELLLGGRTLTASEALRAGLVTRVLWPDRFQVELLPTLKAMSEQSSQSMEATKALLRHSLRKKLDAALESETYLLIQHWCSVECQTAIKAYIDGKVQ